MCDQIEKEVSKPGALVSSSDAASVRTFIHIGYPKCASTYLQRTVFPAMGNFADLTKLPHETKWMLFDEKADHNRFRARVVEGIEHHDPNKDYRIISYEGLVPKLFRTFTDLYWKTRHRDVTRYTYSKQQVAEQLAKAFPEAHIIIIIRKQIDWAISQHKMYWRRGHTSMPVDVYVDRYEDGYDRVIQRYMDLFGVDRVSVVPYELLLQDPTTFVRSVTGVIDPSFEPEISQQRVNYAPDFLRDMNYQRSKRVLKRKMRESDGLLRRFTLKLAYWGVSLAGRPYYTFRYGRARDEVRISESTLKAIRPALVESNREVERITGLDLGQYGYYVDDGGDTQAH